MEISVADAHNRLSRWLKRLNEGPVTITRRGAPVGVIVDPVEYEQLRQVKAYLQMLDLAKDLQGSGLSAGELHQASRAELEKRA